MLILGKRSVVNAYNPKKTLSFVTSSAKRCFKQEQIYMENRV